MSHTTTEHHGGVSDLEELNAYIERGEAKKVEEMLELKEDMETVFVPFPPAIVNGKALIPSICEAVKKSTSVIVRQKAEEGR